MQAQQSLRADRASSDVHPRLDYLVNVFGLSVKEAQRLLEA